jgi:D-alanyl-D-alanine carboxypeptidase
MATLLTKADALPWGPKLRAELPGPGDGTIQETHSLHGVNVRAKTGSLDGISALSGWVWLSTTGRWAEFSILDRGMASWFSKPMEDEIVRTIARYAR